MDQIHCMICNRSLARERQRHQLTSDIIVSRPGLASYVRDHGQIEMLATGVQWMCHRCWVAATRQEAGIQHQDDDINQDEPPLLAAPVVIGNIVISEFRRTSNTSNRCLFPDCTSRVVLRVPHFIKILMLIESKLYISPSARVCENHLNNWGDVSQFHNSSFTAEHIEDMLSQLISAYNERHVFDFDNVETMTPAELHFVTGMTHLQFQQMLDETPLLLEHSQRPKTVLGAYLMKIRSGEPNDRLASRLNMSRRTFERKLAVARECLLSEFVPRHLGWDHISREEIIERNLLIPNEIHIDNEDSKAIVVCDGTYMYVQKSTNFLFQKRSYSLHKYRNLLKPFVMVCTDGYIIDVTGPHAATTSDATIMSNMMNQVESPIHYVLQENDIFILDRGFRDSIVDIQSCGYDTRMPPTKGIRETRLSTADANSSRLVTIVRWIVEVVNGRFKRDFKIFRHEYFNRALSHMFKDVRIAAAVINAFKEPVRNSPHAAEIVRIINEKKNMPNALGDFIVENNVNRQRAVFTRITDEGLRPTFPILTEEDLVLIALGTYQIKLARSYLSEHIRNGVYNIEICESLSPNLREYGIDLEDGILIRGRIHSRHISNKVYYSYILINRRLQGRQALHHYYCSCLTGRRTVGTCAHIMSIMWYLGWGIHQERVLLPALLLDEIIVDFDY